MIARFEGGPADGQSYQVRDDPPPFRLEVVVPVVMAADGERAAEDPLSLLPLCRVSYALCELTRDHEGRITSGLYRTGDHLQPERRRAERPPAPPTPAETLAAINEVTGPRSGPGGTWEPCPACRHYAEHEMIGGRPFCPTCAGDCQKAS